MSGAYRLDEPERVAVIGAGSWGTALAYHLACGKKPVDLWAFEPEVAEQINGQRENLTYLPDVKLPDIIKCSNSLEEVVRGQRVILLVVPSHVMRSVVAQAAPFLSPGVVLCNAAKGIENDTLMTMSQVLEDVLPPELPVHRACLSGPSFAREVGENKPTAITMACQNREASRLVQKMMSSPMMRVYTSNDLIGLEIGGALKNVFAIGAGISDGLGLGTNARAALITRALAEMSRLGVKMGANPLTFMGLAGLGDLVLTCTGDLSRNRTVGRKLGAGMKLRDILAEMKMVAEGVKTTRSAHGLGLRQKVEMPLTEQIYHILYEDKAPKHALFDLMTRDLKDEIDHVLMI